MKKKKVGNLIKKAIEKVSPLWKGKSFEVRNRESITNEARNTFLSGSESTQAEGEMQNIKNLEVEKQQILKRDKELTQNMADRQKVIDALAVKLGLKGPKK